MIVRIIAGAPEVFIEEFSNDYVIGVDLGIEHAIKRGIKVDLAVGDFDSVDKRYLTGLKTIELNPIKDETDLFVAITEAIKLKPEKIYIYGATNGRFDHYLANVHLLDLYNIEIVDEVNRIFLKDSNFCLKKRNTYVSFFYYSGNPIITLKGFKYPLKNYRLNYGDSLCVSNEIIDDFGEILINNGKVLVVLCNK